MKNRANIELETIKSNDKILLAFKKTKKYFLPPYINIYFSKQRLNNKIVFVILVSKKQFKLAVTRNKIKRQIRAILINSKFKGNCLILFKPNAEFLAINFQKKQNDIYKLIKKLENE